MEPTNIDAVQVSWLWKISSGLTIAIAGIVAWAYRRLDRRVYKLETDSADLEHITELREALRDLSLKIDRYSERAEERNARLMEKFIDTIQSR